MKINFAIYMESKIPEFRVSVESHRFQFLESEVSTVSDKNLWYVCQEEDKRTDLRI